MKYAEIIFETGAKSVLSYENEDEVRRFIAEHHRRAINGEPGAPQDQTERPDLSHADFAIMPSIDRMKERPAERISKVYLYDKHPADLHNPRVSADVVKKLVDGMSDDSGTLDHEQLTRALRDEASPVDVLAGRLDSLYKGDATGELDLSFLKDA